MRFTRVLLLVALAALVVVPAAFALRFTDDSYNMPQGFTGQGYSKTFGGAGGCGPALPYQYRVIAGALPPGLSLSSGGTISGVPTQGGNYDFWVELSDENPPSASLVYSGQGPAGVHDPDPAGPEHQAERSQPEGHRNERAVQLPAHHRRRQRVAVVVCGSGALPPVHARLERCHLRNAHGDRRLHVQDPGDRRWPQ